MNDAGAQHEVNCCDPCYPPVSSGGRVIVPNAHLFESIGELRRAVSVGTGRLMGKDDGDDTTAEIRYRRLRPSEK